MVSQVERDTMTGEELEEWKGLVSSGKRAVKGLETNQWRLGDLAVEASGNRHYGQHSLELFAEEIGLPYNTLRVYVGVSKAYPSDTRVSNLSWSHHRELTEREDRHEWLTQAKSNNWSILAMKRAIREAESRVQAPEKPKPTTEKETPNVPGNEPVKVDPETSTKVNPICEVQDWWDGQIHVITPDGEACRPHEVLITALGMLKEFSVQFDLDTLCEHILEDAELGADLSEVMRWMYKLKTTLIAAGQPGEVGEVAIS